MHQLLTVVLAAGRGTRMKSALPKVLHPIAGLPMVGHVLRAARSAGSGITAIVVGPGMESIARFARTEAEDIEVYIQEQQLGTGNALLAARRRIEHHQGDVLVLYGDTPLITGATLKRLRGALDDGAAVAVLGFEPADPTGYGRLITSPDGDLVAIREHKDASPEERAVRLCNSGVMAFRLPSLLAVLDRIGNDNAKGEYYLTDAVEIARQDGGRATAIVCPEREVMGVNSRDQLAVAERLWQEARREAVMLAGVTLIAPDSVWLSHDTELGQDVTIEPNVFFGPGVHVEDRVTIKANTHIQGIDGKSREGVVVRSGAEIGPFARIRPGADIGPDVHIGNFVEVKAAILEAGAKANHLSYIGDGRVGAGANIGAGTIFCNYDGFFKHKTDIGKGAFIGSNSSLVAPVRIGDGAFIGSGSVITNDVPADSLALSRPEQTERPGWAAKFRTMMQRRKAGKAAE
ncbi:MAG: bifunctional UDP-N-acetylglucosamine diphosphorylase/glucosamine-1-phosphate N-acetyltransferase GlmU [Hyphomicrobiaceae bacterium]|nr:bifunctional UDP-N-acetylglucosamine diphosphorylase/glucosamine-1-phosphate N-acetyltransferase GlmU [Hyphomicrobiaceae bacterium]